ncbi:hypothetical protein FACS1894166_01010 [Bacilli bacterium]|nr:hypothetical protein FACS1894166_01010 [Bacilli bacterium]
MKNVVRYSELFLCYKNLFTKTQVRYLNDYFINDMSLGEVAKKYHVTNMAIADNIKRCKKRLDELEKALHLYEKQHKRFQIYGRMKDRKMKKVLIAIDNI